MKILFTGASSFSGMWFVKALVQNGHEVITTYRLPYEAYTGIRKQRMDQLIKISQPVFEASFGHKSFLAAINRTSPNLLCHHAAEVTNYKSPEFNPTSALANNTFNLKEVLQTLKNCDCHQVILTGSVFEQHEGAGTENLRAVSPYGLSKGLTSDTFAYYTTMLQMKLGKFVIPNPFGPYEEDRFTSYLARQWISGKSPTINTPQYVRDNIPISLLARAYAHFACKLSNTCLNFIKCNPSFYVESQASFTQRFSDALKKRLTLPCNYELKIQTDFSEPLIRINTETVETSKFQWNDSQFWDELSTYYINTFT